MSLSLSRAAQLLDVTYRQAYTWSEKGYVKYSTRDGIGHAGQERYIEMREYTVMEAMAALVKAGMLVNRAHDYARGETDLAEIEKALEACRSARVSRWVS